MIKINVPEVFSDELYNCIKKYYSKKKEVQDYPDTSEEWKRLGEALKRKYDGCNEKEQNAALKKELLLLYPDKIKDTSTSQEPSYRNEIILEEFHNESFYTACKLVYSISLIGPYYSIYGVEYVRIVRENPNLKRYAYFGNVMHVSSPASILKTPFNKVRDLIEKRFKGYKMIPYFVLKEKVNELHIKGNDDHVYEALFGFGFDPNVKVHGDNYFGSEEWGFNPYEGGWTVYPPAD